MSNAYGTVCDFGVYLPYVVRVTYSSSSTTILMEYHVEWCSRPNRMLFRISIVIHRCDTQDGALIKVARA